MYMFAMTAGMIIGLSVVGVLVLIGVILLLMVLGAWNRLVTLRERTRNAFAQIDVQLNRRYDLIPNLVETCKGYMAHERETLESVMAARASATQARIEVNGDPTNAPAMGNLMQAEGALGGAMSRLMAVMENYPDLKANENMAQLMETLESTENKVAFARQAYNDASTSYNTYKQKVIVPVLTARLGNFQDAPYFEVEDEEARNAPKVSF